MSDVVAGANGPLRVVELDTCHATVEERDAAYGYALWTLGARVVDKCDDLCPNNKNGPAPADEG